MTALGPAHRRDRPRLFSFVLPKKFPLQQKVMAYGAIQIIRDAFFASFLTPSTGIFQLDLYLDLQASILYDELPS